MKLSSTSNTVTRKRTNKGVYLSRIFLDFFLKPVYPNMVEKSFKFLVLRSLEDKFLLMSLSKPLPQAEGNYHFPPNRIFWKSVFHPAERVEGYGAEKTAKVKLVRVLVTSFDIPPFLQPLHFLSVSVFLYRNLDSSMLKCEGSLIFSLKSIQ